MNSALEEFFKKTKDGYMFIGGQEQVSEILQQNAQKTIDSFK